MKGRLPLTAKDILKFSPREWLIFNGSIAFYKLTGLWKYPIPASGDLETMSRKDAIYWVYKAQYPVTRAVRNSGLEAFFADQARFAWALPAGFKPAEELELSAVGDLINLPYLPKTGDGLYDEVAETIFGADVSMANLECVVFSQASGAFEMSTSSGPPLSYSLEEFDVVKGPAGRKFSFMATAGNHSLDFGVDGVASTIRRLRAEGIAFHGMNELENDAQAATILEKKGFKIGFISHTFGLNGKKPPKDKPWIVNRCHLNGSVGEVDFSVIERQIGFARKNNVDVIVAQLHWGLEHEYYPRPAQLEVAHHLAELGVDIVIGHHPHVIQPMECYRTLRDPDRVVPIYYSLGNLMTPFSLPAFRKSAVARITLAKGAARDGAARAYVKSARMVEVFQEIDEENKRIRLIGGDHGC